MIRLNPALDSGTLAREFAQASGRAQFRDVLAAEDAEWTCQQLETTTPWGLVFNDGGRVEELSNAQLGRMSPEQINRIYNGVIERAKTQYQFLYHIYPLSTAYFDPAADAPILRFYEFLNRPETLDYFRAVTGRPDIRWAMAQATLFARGHFLKSHSDLEPHNNRRAIAFVFNFTRLWERDWGGYLQFYSKQHDIELAWRPIFNALNIFTVPHDHGVEMVTGFAGGRRFAITGWFRTDEPPGEFGRFAD